jgi:hypothetical protein
MDRPVDREDFRAFVAWWFKGFVPDEIPEHVKEAYENNDPELLEKTSPIWNTWWQHHFGQNPNSLVYKASKDQTFTGPRGGIYKTTANGRRYL